MGWPDDRDLPVEVHAAFGADVAADPGTWSWTSLSSRLRAESIRLRAGKSGGAGQVSPGTCTVTLDNDDAALTPLHPISPYWPNVELGTPLRVRLRLIEDSFTRTAAGGWGVSDSDSAWSVAVGPPGDQSVSGGVGRHSHPTANVLRRSILAASLVDCEQVVDVSTSALLTGAALVTGLVFREAAGQNYYWLRCEFNAGGTSVMLKISKCVNSVFTDLAVLNPVPGLAYAANTPMRVRASVVGSRLAIKAWPAAGAEPSGWQLTATDSTHTAAGAVGIQSWLVAGNSNTLPVVASFDNYAAGVDRFSGFADQWEPNFLPTTTPGQASSSVRVTASGLLRRLGQGTPAALSPLRRSIAASAQAYWPLEDGGTTTAAGSAFAGHAPLTVTGGGDVPQFADVTDMLTSGALEGVGTNRMADLSGGAQLTATVPTSVTAGTGTPAGWSVMLAGQLNDITAIVGDVILLDIATPGGTYVRWQMVIHGLPDANFGLRIVAYNAAGTVTTVIPPTSFGVGFQISNLSIWQNGANISVGYRWFGSGWEATGSVAGTVSGITQIGVNTAGATSTNSMPAGHLAVWGDHPVPSAIVGDITTGDTALTWPFAHFGAVESYRYEPAHVRLARLCAEDGISLSLPSVPADTMTRMGPQPIGARLELYRECADADMGVLYEDGFGLAYLPRESRYNKPVDLVVDLSTYCVAGGDEASVLKPIYDDQGIRNELTVNRSSGSSVVVSDEDSQRRNGVYADSVELNLAIDEQLADQAAWRLHLDSDQDLREATFPIDLAANPGLLGGWLSCQVGSRIVRTNPPAQHRPGPLDRTVAGWTETIGPRSWLVQVAPSAAQPWDVATADGEQRVAADGTVLAAAITTAGALSFQITSTVANGPWTTDPADFPLLVQVGDEVMEVSTITGSGLAQTAIVSVRGVNGVARAYPVGTPVDVAEPAIAPL